LANHSAKDIKQNLAADLQPLQKMHFAISATSNRGGLNYDGDDFRKGNLASLITLAVTAFLILVISCVNFINLPTVQAIKRLKEVGVRKVLGSSIPGLNLLFLMETIIVTSASVLAAVLLVNPALSLFELYIPAGVVFDLNIITVSFLLLVFFLTVVLAGFYPTKFLAPVPQY
jgi:putative ABC transport system permease protein